jgi:hypothetical protein
MNDLLGYAALAVLLSPTIAVVAWIIRNEFLRRKAEANDLPGANERQAK